MPAPDRPSSIPRRDTIMRARATSTLDRPRESLPRITTRPFLSCTKPAYPLVPLNRARSSQREIRGRARNTGPRESPAGRSRLRPRAAPPRRTARATRTYTHTPARLARASPRTRRVRAPARFTTRMRGVGRTRARLSRICRYGRDRPSKNFFFFFCPIWPGVL